MEKNTKILLGLGAVIAAYLILKPKKALGQTKSIQELEQEERIKYLAEEANKPDNVGGAAHLSPETLKILQDAVLYGKNKSAVMPPSLLELQNQITTTSF